MNPTTIAVRVNPANPRHHLWNNNGTWFVHYTAYPTPVTKQRFRVSLGTKRFDEAQRKRDRLLRQLAGRRRSIWFALEPSHSVEPPRGKEI